MENNLSKAPHVLNASSNLVGFLFFLFMSLKLFLLGQNLFVDELVAVIVVSFILSCVFSFFSMRSQTKEKSDMFETIADYIFLGALFLLLVVCVLLTFTY